MRGNYAHPLSVIVAACALTLAACGGDSSDDTSKQTKSSQERAATRTYAPNPQPESSTPPSSGGAKLGKGGSSSSGKTKSGTADKNSSSTPPASGGNGTSTATPSQGKEARGLTKKEKLQRYLRDPATHREIYRQGRTFCLSFGMEEIAKEWHIFSNDPRQVAQRYANIYEKQYPQLRLPYFQGCVEGFKVRAKREQRKRKAKE